MNKENLKYLDCDLYQVETDEQGVKWVHIDGYCYSNEEGYQQVQASGCYITIEELNGDPEHARNAFDNSKQYQGQISEESVCKYYEGAKELSYSKVTQETPDGWYIN